MKIIAFVFLSISFTVFFNSCEKEKSITPSNEALGREIVSKKKYDITPETSLPFRIKNNSIIGNSERLLKTPLGWTEFGPYTITPSLTLLTGSYYTYLPSSALYTAGNYICQLWQWKSTVTLQPGDIFAFYGATKNGYNNYSTKEIGTLVTSSDNTYEIITYSIVPLTNSLGQDIHYNGTLPTDLRNNTYTYSYLRNI